MCAFQSHRKTLTYQRTCRQVSQLVYHVPFTNVPQFVCPPACTSQACVQGSGAIWEPKICTILFSEICTKSVQFENLHISRKVEFPRVTCSQAVHIEGKVKLQKNTICFEKNNYVLRLQPAPTTTDTN